MANEGEETPKTGLNEQWGVAKKCAEKFGYVPSSFTVAVRALISDQFANKACIRPVTKYQLARLLRSSTFKVMLYFATRDLRGAYVADKKSWSVGMMMDLFEPFDLAALISSFVFYRKAKKLLPEENFSLVSKRICLESQFAAQVGASVPPLGIAAPLLVATLPHYAYSAMMLANPTEVKKYYKQFVAKNSQEVDLEKEPTVLGCTNSQISVYLLSNFGFGTDIANALSMASDPKSDINSITDDLTLRMKIAGRWINGLVNGRMQPLEKLPAVFFPMSGERLRFEGFVNDIRKGRQCFLDYGKADLTPEKTPHLFAEQNVSEDVPEKLKDVFSVEDITKMEEEDFDKLVDQIDAEQEGKTPKGTIVLKDKEIRDLEEMVQ